MSDIKQDYEKVQQTLRHINTAIAEITAVELMPLCMVTVDEMLVSVTSDYMRMLREHFEDLKDDLVDLEDDELEQHLLLQDIEEEILDDEVESILFGVEEDDDLEDEEFPLEGE